MVHNTCADSEPTKKGGSEPVRKGQEGERLAGIDPKAKQKIEINGRTRIPDALDSDSLTEVKNVKYISNTLQLRDYADIAKATGRSLKLIVGPETQVSGTVKAAGWKVYRF